MSSLSGMRLEEFEDLCYCCKYVGGCPIVENLKVAAKTNLVNLAVVGCLSWAQELTVQEREREYAGVGVA